MAEGIETDAQLGQLLSFGCKLGQGYLFSKAVDRNAATSLLARYGQQGEFERRPLKVKGGDRPFSWRSNHSHIAAAIAIVTANRRKIIQLCEILAPSQPTFSVRP